MRISLTLPESNMVTNHGYGVAAYHMVRALQDLGHEVPFQDPTAPVEIAFCQPYLWEWSNPDAYHIGYVPWESTTVPAKWLPAMHEADEIWTTSPWCKDVFERNGLEDVKVYMHGVDASAWPRSRRRPERRPAGTEGLRFLFAGEPAPRKGGQLVYDTFIDLFGEDSQETLTIKAHGQNTVRGKNTKNVKLITADFDDHQMSELFRRHDVLVYPSWGEGFGLIPLQALASGMPVICTGAWAPYKEFLLPELTLPSMLVHSPWQEMHPGNVYMPSEKALRGAMISCADPKDFRRYSAQAYANSHAVEAAFDWKKLTAEAFDNVLINFGTAVS